MGHYGTSYLWNKKCEQAFAKLKDCVSTTPVLWGSNWNVPFHIATDASNTTMGVFLG